MNSTINVITSPIRPDNIPIRSTMMNDVFNVNNMENITDDCVSRTLISIKFSKVRITDIINFLKVSKSIMNRLVLLNV
ncbi:MAG: hypothetical protein QXH99_00745 [Sulfolobales archaeon]